MSAPCTKCEGRGTVPLFAGAGIAPCPRCFPRATMAERAGAVGPGEAVLAIPAHVAVVPAPPAPEPPVVVHGVRVTDERLAVLDLVSIACRANGITFGEFLRRARRAVAAGDPS